MEPFYWGQDYLINYGFSGHPATDHVLVEVLNFVGNCWEGLIYNWSFGQWEQKALSCGTPSRFDGWSMWESYYADPDPYCPVYDHIDANVIIFVTPPGWNQLKLSQANISQLGPTGSCWTSNVYYMDWLPGRAGLWEAFTPYPPSGGPPSIE